MHVRRHARATALPRRPGWRGVSWLVVALLLGQCRVPDPDAAGAGGAVAATPAASAPPRDLAPGAAVTRSEMAPGDVVTFTISLQPGQVVRVVAEQQGADIALRLDDPSGQPILRVDRDTWEHGDEVLLAAAERPGTHRVIVEVLASLDRRAFRIEASIEAMTPALRMACAGYQSFAAAKQRRSRQHAKLRETSVREALDRSFRDASTHLLAAGEPVLAAEATAARGLVAQQAQDHRGAIVHYRVAAEGFATRAPVLEALTRHRLGAMLLNTDQTAEAIDQYEQVRRLATARGVRKLMGEAEHHLSQAHQRRGAIQRALVHGERALAIWRQRPGCTDYASTAHNLGVLSWTHLHRPVRARELLDEALRCWRAEGYERQRLETLGQIGQVQRAQGALRDAELTLRAAFDGTPENRPCHRAQGLARRAAVAERLGKRGEALRFAAASESLLASSALPPVASSCGLRGIHARRELAAVYRAVGRLDAALDAYQRYRRYARQADSALEEARALAGLARTLDAMGRPDEALIESARAVALVEPMRVEIERSDLRAHFVAAVQDVLDGFVDLHWSNARRADPASAAIDALAAAERARARSFHDRLAALGVDLVGAEDQAPAREWASLQREIAGRSARGSDTAGLASSLERLLALEAAMRSAGHAVDRTLGTEPIVPSDFQDLLRDESVLFFQLGEARSLLWLIEGDSIRAFALPPRARLTALARAATDDMARAPSAGVTDFRCALSRATLGPVRDALAEAAERPLIIVADGALLNVSFAALPLPPAAGASCDGARLIIDQHPVSYLPSLSTLDLLHSRGDRQRASRPVLAFGDPVYARDPRCAPRAGIGRELARLPATAVEISRLCELTDGDCVHGFAATRARFLAPATGDYRTLHVAAHAWADDAQPVLSALVLSERDRQCRPRHATVRAYEIAGLDLAADLAVLSACDSGAGTLVAGEGLVNGLVRGLFAAGAQRVIASLWQVDDVSAAEQMADFYRHLVAGGSPAEALRASQRARRDRAPRDWASFVLHGNPWPLDAFP